MREAAPFVQKISKAMHSGQLSLDGIKFIIQMLQDFENGAKPYQVSARMKTWSGEVSLPRDSERKLPHLERPMTAADQAWLNSS